MNFGMVLSVSLHLVIALMLTLELYTKPIHIHEPETIVIDLIEIKEKNNVKTTKQKAPIKTTEEKLAEKFYKTRQVDSNTKAQKPEEVKEADLTKEVVERHAEKLAVQPKVVPPAPLTVSISQSVPAPEPVQKKSILSEKPNPKTTLNNVTTKNINSPKPKINKKDSKKHEIDSFAKSVMDTLDVNTAKNKQYKSSISDVLGSTEEQFEVDAKISLSEVNYIRRKISQHWNTTYFASISAMDLGADILVVLNRDGSIKHVEIEHSYGRSLQQYNMFLDSVLSAVWKASPLDQLTPEHFDSWHEIVISFDPSGMVW